MVKKEYMNIKLKTGGKIPLSSTEVKIARKRFRLIEQLERTSMTAKYGDTQLAIPDKIRKKAERRGKRFKLKEEKKIKLGQRKIELSIRKAKPKRTVKERFMKRR